MNNCACGTKPRQVINGNNERLTYWYCDTCKDEPKVLSAKSGAPIFEAIAAAYMDVLISGSGSPAPSQQPQPVGPLIVAPTVSSKYQVWGINRNGLAETVTVPSKSPCSNQGHQGPEPAYSGSGNFQVFRCSCREVAYS